MDVKNLIQATANHIRVTQLAVGDCFKRLVDSSYSGPELKYGIVTGILSDGDTAVITALEFNDRYGSDDRVEAKVFKSGNEETIFPATPEEIVNMTAKFIERCESDVKTAERALEKKQDQLAQAVAVASRIKSGELTAPRYEELENING